MELAPLVRAAEGLMSPLEWGSQEVWLAECVRRVRAARGLPESPDGADALLGLEELLRLPGDHTDWLRRALMNPDEEPCPGGFAAAAGGGEAVLPLISLRCALAAGLARLQLSPGLPTTQELRVAFGLRGREPQVALLAAEGLSNAAIAERLRLSAHTVRHYLERVMDRLGLHSRKALALRLMAGGGERPEEPNRR